MAEELETAQIPPHIMAAMRERMKLLSLLVAYCLRRIPARPCGGLCRRSFNTP